MAAGFLRREIGPAAYVRLGPTTAMAKATSATKAAPMTNAIPEAVESNELSFGFRMLRTLNAQC